MTHSIDHPRQQTGMTGVVVVAAIAGVAAGILLAPRKGSETRRYIKQRIELAKQRSEERMAEAKAKAHAEADKLAQTADTLREDVSAAVSEARSQVEDAASEVKARTRKTTPTSTS